MPVLRIGPLNSSWKDIPPWKVGVGVEPGVGVGVGAGIGVGAGVGIGAGISMAAMFHRSWVGAVSETVTTDPATWSVVSD